MSGHDNVEKRIEKDVPLVPYADYIRDKTNLEFNGEKRKADSLQVLYDRCTAW